MIESRKDEQRPVPANENQNSANLPSSAGDSPQQLPPGDVSSKEASVAERTKQKIASANQQQHDEALLDDAVEQTFPASDPVAELPAAHEHGQYGAGCDEEEESLDHAIEMTFPASDPIAIATSEETAHEKNLRNSKPNSKPNRPLAQSH